MRDIPLTSQSLDPTPDIRGGDCKGAGQSISDPCKKCQGQGRTQEQKTLSVKIPAGVDTGDRIRLSGEGEQSLQNKKIRILIVLAILWGVAFIIGLVWFIRNQNKNKRNSIGIKEEKY